MEHEKGNRVNEWKKEKHNIDALINEIQKTRFQPPLHNDLKEIVATIATNGRMLKTPDDIKKKAEEIDLLDDEVGTIYNKKYGSLIQRHDRERKENLRRSFSIRRSEGYLINNLKKYTLRAELKIKVASHFKHRDPEDMFTSIEWWNCSVLLDTILQHDNPYKRKPIKTVYVNEKYL